MSEKFVIIVDRATAAQLNAAHEAIKANSNGWWHHFENTWIVSSEMNASEWRDTVKSAIDAGLVGFPGEMIRSIGGGGSVLVLRISDKSPKWAFSGKKGLDWLKKTLTSKKS